MLTADFSTASWRKSSRSGSNGGQCVEVAFVRANADWRKSSRSSSSGGQCVEVAFVAADSDWHKSSRSQGNGGQCVEVAVEPSVVGIRDSKAPDGPVLAFDRTTFSTFLHSLKTGAR